MSLVSAIFCLFSFSIISPLHFLFQVLDSVRLVFFLCQIFYFYFRSFVFYGCQLEVYTIVKNKCPILCITDTFSLNRLVHIDAFIRLSNVMHSDLKIRETSLKKDFKEFNKGIVLYKIRHLNLRYAGRSNQM